MLMSESKAVVSEVKKMALSGRVHLADMVENQPLNGTAWSLAKAKSCLDEVATTVKLANKPMMLVHTRIAVAADADLPTAL